MRRKIVVGVIALAAFLPLAVFAYSVGPGGTGPSVTPGGPTGAGVPNEAPNVVNYLNEISGGSGIVSSDIPTFIGSIIKWILGIVGVGLLILFVYGGIRYAISAGNEEGIESGKKIMTYAVIGVAVISVAYLLASYVISALVVGNGAGSGGGTPTQFNAAPTDATPFGPTNTSQFEQTNTSPFGPANP